MRKSAPVSFGSVAVRLPHAEAGQRIGLLGGSFNPPHAAHLLVSRIALARLGLDRIWWVVTPGNPLKSHDELAPLEQRLAACRDLARDQRILVTAFEAELGTSYTAATLGFLRQRQAKVHHVWIMGADCLAHFHKWQHWRDIFRMMPIAVIDRPGWHLKALSSPAARAFASTRWPQTHVAQLPLASGPAWSLLSGPLSPLSSTALRAAEHDRTDSGGGAT
jgi:nicotinate-nucleotide adenylyltransferase